MVATHNRWIISAVQKIQKLSESPVTAHMVAELCVINWKNRKITHRLVLLNFLNRTSGSHQGPARQHSAGHYIKTCQSIGEVWTEVQCFLVLLRAFECLWLLCNALKWFWLLCRTLELCPVQCRQSALVWSRMGAPTLTSAAPLLSACIWTSFFFIGSGHHQHKHLTPQGKVWRIGGASSAKMF